MKYVTVILTMLVLTGIVYAQAVPQEQNTQTLNKVDQEHKATRKFVSDEMTRQREQIFKDFDARAVYYENEFFRTIDDAVLKLTILWAGIVLLSFGLSNLLRNRLEQRRFDKLKQSIIKDLKPKLSPAPPPPAPSTTVQPDYTEFYMQHEAEV